MGMGYLGLCDHSKAAAYAGGLDAERVRQQQTEIDALNASYDGAFRILKGIEVDILHDGKLDFDDEVLASFDIVVAAVHSLFTLSQEEQTRRILRAMESPYVDIVAHVTGRILLQRDGYALDLTKVIDSAADRGVAIEVNAHPSRLDLDWRDLRYALKRGMKTSINPDAPTTRMASVGAAALFRRNDAVGRNKESRENRCRGTCRLKRPPLPRARRSASRGSARDGDTRNGPY